MRMDLPICSRERFRLLFTVVSYMGWQIHSIDVTTASLQGNELEREIFRRPQLDVCSKELVWSLRYCIYGLNDAPCAWYEIIHAEFKRLGGVVSTYDNALFLWHDDNGMLIGILVSQVDDFACAGNQNFQTTVIEEFKKTFKIKQHETARSDLWT